MAYRKNNLSLGSRPNYVYAFISMTLVLFLLGLLGLGLVQGRFLITTFKESIGILVELREEVKLETIDSLKNDLASYAFVKPHSVKLITKEMAAAEMQSAFGDDFRKLGLPNPFYNILSFNVPEKYFQSDSLNLIRAELKQWPEVHDVFYQDTLIEKIIANVGRIGLVVLSITLFFLIVALVIIHNTTRLSIYANRLTIKNMELVGASWGYISRPYLWRSVIMGMGSAFLAIGLVAAFWFLIQQQFPELNDPSLWVPLALVAAGILLFGAGLNFFSTWAVVRKYLKMRMDDVV